jgi:hypothetical protein
MAKDLIIGVFSNYGYDEVKPWVKSAKECGFEGDVVLVALDVEEKTCKQIEADGVIVIRAKNNSKMLVHMERFYHIHQYLSQNTNYELVISTDVRDVVFQRNPSDWWNNNIAKETIVSSSESILIKNEEWNKMNIINNFGEYFYNEIKEEEVQCVGILAGWSHQIKELSFYLFQMSLNRHDWVADQAAYNMIIHRSPWKELTYFAKLENAWAINGHVTNYEEDKMKFEPFLLEDRPKVVDGLICNNDGYPFCIVHQYDRVREWKKIYEDKYGVKIKSQYTPDLDNNMIVINTGV